MASTTNTKPHLNESAWTYTVQTARTNFDKDDFQDAIRPNSFQHLQKCMRDLCTDYHNQGLPKWLEKIAPLISNLEAFSKGIDVLSQADTILCLLWGSLRLLLTLASRYLYILRDVLDMLESIDRKMPRFEVYASLMGTNDRVQAQLAEFYRLYIDFVVRTYRFLKRHKLFLVIRLLWTSEKTLFSDTMGRIEKQTQEIEHETHAASMEIDKVRHDQVVNLISTMKMSESLPAVKPCRSIPFSSNPRFFNRPRYLQLIDKCLRPHIYDNKSCGEQMRIFALHGFAGVGKTQLAIQYTYDHWGDFDVILWASADGNTKIIEDYANHAKRMGLTDTPDQNVASRAMMNWFQDTSLSWLLVLDNADDKPASFTQQIPKGTRGGVLVTTQNKAWESTFATGSAIVETLDDTEASSMINWLLNKTAISTASEQTHATYELAQQLGGHPLAIAQMCGYILETKCPLRKFLELYQRLEDRRILQDKQTSLSSVQYNLNFNSMWTLSFESLTPSAMDLISICAFLDRESIPDALFESFPFLREDLSHLKTTFQFNESIRSLLSHSLMNRNEEGILSMHGLVQEATIERITQQSDLMGAFDKATWLVYHAHPRQSPLGEPIPDWPKCDLYLKHVLALHSRYRSFVSNNAVSEIHAETCRLLEELFCDSGVYLWARGILTQAEDLARSSIDLGNSTSHRDEYLHAQALTLLGCVHIFQDERLGEAIPVLLDAVESRKRRANSTRTCQDDIQLANAYNNLCFVLAQAQRYEEGVEAHEQCMKIKDKWPDPSMNWLLALYHNNIGRLRQAQGLLHDALHLFTVGLEIAQADAKSQEQTTLHRVAGFVYSVGHVQYELGDIERAQEHLLEVLDMQQKNAGERHIITGMACHRLGVLSLDDGQLDDALLLFRRACAIFEDPNQFSEAKLARTLYCLADVLRRVKEKDQEGGKREKEADALYHRLKQARKGDTRDERMQLLESIAEQTRL